MYVNFNNINIYEHIFANLQDYKLHLIYFYYLSCYKCPTLVFQTGFFSTRNSDKILLFDPLDLFLVPYSNLTPGNNTSHKRPQVTKVTKNFCDPEKEIAKLQEVSYTKDACSMKNTIYKFLSKF